MGADAFKAGVVKQIIATMGFLKAQLLAIEFDFGAQNAKSLQEVEVLVCQRRTDAASVQQGAKRFRRDRFGHDLSTIDKLLQNRIVKHLTADDASLNQAQKPVDEHFGAAIQTKVKASQLPASNALRAKRLKYFLILHTMPVPHN